MPELPEKVHIIWAGDFKNDKSVTSAALSLETHVDNPIKFWCLQSAYSQFQKEFRDLPNIEVCSIDQFVYKEARELKGVSKESHHFIQAVLDDFYLNNKDGGQHEFSPGVKIRRLVNIVDVFKLFVLATEGGYCLDTNMQVDKSVGDKQFTLPKREHFTMTKEKHQLLTPQEKDIWMLYSPLHHEAQACIAKMLEVAQQRWLKTNEQYGLETVDLRETTQDRMLAVHNYIFQHTWILDAVQSGKRSGTINYFPVEFLGKNQQEFRQFLVDDPLLLPGRLRKDMQRSHTFSVARECPALATLHEKLKSKSPDLITFIEKHYAQLHPLFSERIKDESVYSLALKHCSPDVFQLLCRDAKELNNGLNLGVEVIEQLRKLEHVNEQLENVVSNMDYMVSQIKDINQTKVLYDGLEHALILALSEQFPNIAWKAFQQGRIDLDLEPNTFDDDNIYTLIMNCDLIDDFLKEYVHLKQQYTKAALKYDQLVKRSKPYQSLIHEPEYLKFIEVSRQLENVEKEYAKQQQRLKDGGDDKSFVQRSVKDFTHGLASPANTSVAPHDVAKALCGPAENATGAALKSADAASNPPQKK